MIVITAGKHLSTTGGSPSQSDKSDHDVSENTEVSPRRRDSFSCYSCLSL